MTSSIRDQVSELWQGMGRLCVAFLGNAAINACVVVVGGRHLGYILDPSAWSPPAELHREALAVATDLCHGGKSEAKPAPVTNRPLRAYILRSRDRTLSKARR
jgi:hypothetical protein